MQLKKVMSVLKLSDLEYLHQPPGPRDSQKTSQGLGPLLYSTPLLGLGTTGGTPGPEGETDRARPWTCLRKD